ncbi:uncharacterized protein BDZ99DRAFT_374934 [Mytilinidion resinicola]|uniref:Nicotinamide N-methyltransferase n=1 Tax=Mytilinidion resinicola TaxID=574789 RepID=A0A6A6ZA54_9PEZI|nr:uncharacterized protein BDZ99DRAFT_374934 [Mytilinidion resinicola]KAF2817613.1 hypothetical protein BDZ99DRAFT_374934 [Mytilinidion resinicola]
MLPSLIRLRSPPTAVPEPEDYLFSALGTLFPDDCQNMHGVGPDTVILYKNRRFGELELTVADPSGEEERRKFAHYLWNAGVLMGELVGGRKGDNDGDGTDSGVEEVNEDDIAGWGTERWWASEEEEKLWRVKGETVLELGAGVGLAGIISALAGAEEIVISDYPAPELLANITKNVESNVPSDLRSRLSIKGHEWGDLESPFSKENAGRFTRVLAADCLWMPREHHSLARSMLHFLSPSPDARVFVIAGFHTGRAKLAPFFEEVVGEEGLEIEEIYEMDANGVRREWRAERDGGLENMGERKKWLAVARLRRRQ